MAERSGGPRHLVTSADRLARIAHDPQHVGERQLAGCGCFLPHLLVCTAGRSLGTASARPFSTVCVHRGIARLIKNRGPYIRNPVLMYHNTVQQATSAAPLEFALIQNPLLAFFAPHQEIDNEWWLILAGAMSVIFGIIVLVAPGAGALGLVWAIGAYSAVFGILLVGLSLRLKLHRHA